ncbi:unnamed protein product [Nyctereutes procyonoides]|uniref:(raccoon dog) hypothetical protein n=1 Tax=Nyctereutes procyonoides TaxID=34880 RepID=A0A811Z4S8_NYCPR|nr:unnamed protein product [Nyctereutes procyonoides]
MRLWQWTRAWAWLVGLGAIETAPRRENANVLARGAESLLFIERPDFFDYPDSDQARILAVAQFIGEKPVIFVNSGPARKGPKELDTGPGLCPECQTDPPLLLMNKSLLFSSLTAWYPVRESYPILWSSVLSSPRPPPCPAPKNWVKRALVAFTQIRSSLLAVCKAPPRVP